MPDDYTDPGLGTPEEAWAPVLVTAGRDPATLHGVRRLVVVSAHPDDETLGAGGLIATATEPGSTSTSSATATAPPRSAGSPTRPRR